MEEYERIRAIVQSHPALSKRDAVFHVSAPAGCRLTPPTHVPPCVLHCLVTTHGCFPRATMATATGGVWCRAGRCTTCGSS